MGIINNDVYVCSNGVQKVGTYISFATETIYVVQNYSGMVVMPPTPGISPPSTNSYSVRANYRIFWDQECRESGKSFIDLKSINTTLTSDQLDSNIYGVLYEQLKVLYPNSSDELRAAPAADASAPAADASAPAADASAPAADASAL